MQRMEETRTPKVYYLRQMNGVRPRGRPKKRWEKVIEEDVESRVEDWKKVFDEEWWTDRPRWKSFVNHPTRQPAGRGYR